MLSVAFPEPLMLVLRWMLLLGPLGLVLFLSIFRETTLRVRIGALFAFLYGVPSIFITHSLAIHMGWWHYGWDALMLGEVPTDIVVGGAILFGPGLFLAFPKGQPFLICLPIILGLHATMFGSLEPLVYAGPNWFWGVIFVFLTAHIPAIYLAKWTSEDRHLPMRCALLAVMTGGMIFAILPALIMEAMGGSWALLERSGWSSGITIILLGIAALIGLSANQMLCLQGGGTPIPLDPTKRLVRSGLYAYISNPMQLSAALCWVILGLYLQNFWIIAAAGMAWIFVQGMVRWHHRNDLLKRFPKGWPEYKINVPEWVPRWKPWIPTSAVFVVADADKIWPKALIHATGLDIKTSLGNATYQPAGEPRQFSGVEAHLFAMTHINFAWALAAHAALIIILAAKYISSHLNRLRKTPA